MTYSTHRFRLKKLLQLYADFLPLCESAEEASRLKREMAVLRSEIEDLGLIRASELHSDMQLVTMTIESSLKF